MTDAPANRLTLFERLRWLVETWPKEPGYRFTPKTPGGEYDRLHRRTLGIAGWQEALVVPGATLARAGGRQDLPEVGLAWWLTVFGSPEYAAHRARALEQLERWAIEHPGGTSAPAAPAFGTGDRYAGFDSGYWDGRIAQPTISPRQFLEYELLLARWLTRFRDFGAAGIFDAEGLDGIKRVTYDRAVWRPGLRIDFINHVLTLPGGDKIHGVETILATDSPANLPGAEQAKPNLANAVAVPDARKRPSSTRDRIKTAMKRDLVAGKRDLVAGTTLAKLAAMKDAEMEERYTGKRTTCRAARKEVLEEERDNPS
jgi:hypothetical protein